MIFVEAAGGTFIKLDTGDPGPDYAKFCSASVNRNSIQSKRSRH